MFRQFVAFIELLDPNIKQLAAHSINCEDNTHQVSLSNELPYFTKLFLSLTQFLYGGANACYYAFLSIWLSYNNFTYPQIGYIRGLNQLSILIFVPILCLLIDVLSNENKSRKKFLFSFLAMVSANSRLIFIYNNSWNTIFCVFISITISLQETVNSIMDSIVLSIIPNPNQYGRYRLFAGLAWGSVSFGLGFVFHNFISINTMFYFYAIFMGSLSIMWFISLSYPVHDAKDIGSIKHVRSVSFYRKLCLFVSQINVFKCELIFCILILGIAFGVINTFLFLRLQELGATTFLMGMTLIVTTFSEFPAFLVVDKALDYFGDFGVLCIGLLAYIIRLCWYGLLGLNGVLMNPYYVLPAELLHGLTYSFIKSSIAVFAYRLSRNENNIDYSSFAQGFLSAIFNGVGQSIGAVVGGIIFDAYGPHYLFFVTALTLLPFLLTLLIQFCEPEIALNVSL